MDRNTTIVDGIPVHVNTAMLDDWDTFELLADLQENPETNSYKAVQLLRILLGDDYANVKEQLRARHEGKLPAEAMAQFMTDLFTALAPNS